MWDHIAHPATADHRADDFPSLVSVELATFIVQQIFVPAFAVIAAARREQACTRLVETADADKIPRFVGGGNQIGSSM